MKEQLMRLVSLLCLVATLATCLVMLPMTATAWEVRGGHSYGDVVTENAGSTTNISYFAGALYQIATQAYAPLESGTYSLTDLFGKDGAYADTQNQVTFYDTYFKAFETADFANGLENTEANGYAEAYQNAVTALIALYPSAITATASGSGTNWNISVLGLNPGSNTNKNIDFTSGLGFWIDFDYYFSGASAKNNYPSFGTNGDYQLRFNNSGAIKINGSSQFSPHTNFSGNTVSMADWGKIGWNRISLFLQQTYEVSSTTEGEVTTYSVATPLTMTIYVNGVEAAVWNATESGIKNFPIFTATVDGEGNVTATNAKWSKRDSVSFYTTSYRTKTDEERRMNRFSFISATRGTKTDISVKPLTYELESGLALPTTEIHPADEQYMKAGCFLVPIQSKDGKVTYTCYEIKNYYDPSKDLDLPTPTASAGKYFVGWVDSNGNSVTTTEDVLKTNGVLTAKAADEYTLTVSNKGVTSALSTIRGNVTLGNESMFWLVGGEVKAAGESLTLTENTTVYAMAPTLLPGAAARASKNSGLRFETKVDAGLNDALASCYKVGTLIIPTDLLGDTAFTKAALDLAGKKYIDLSADLLEDAPKGTAYDANGNLDFYASIVDILAQNYTRKFSAISYIEYDGVRYYSDYNEIDNSRSVYDVAVKSDQAKPNEDYSETVRGFINGVVIIEDGAQVEAYEGYEHPLSASIVDGILTITGDALTEDSLKTVIYNGKTYTGGWKFAEGKFTAKLPE